MHNPFLRFGLIGLSVSGVLTGILWLVLGLPPFLAWVCVINAVALVMYRYDKSIAGSRAMRVPEAVLHLLTLAGGTVGAAGAMWLFPNRHKTSKNGFVLVFILIVVVQVALVVGYLLMR